MIRTASRRLLQSRTSAVGAAATRAHRTYYTVPKLANVSLEKGIPGLYSKEQLDISWTQTQTHAADELKAALIALLENTKGTDLEHQAQAISEMNIEQLLALSKAAPEMDKAVSFFAGQIYNNEFFLSGLRQQSTTITDPTATPLIQRATRSEPYRDIDTEPTVTVNPIPPTPENLQASAADRIGYNAQKDFFSQITYSFGSQVTFKENLLAHAEAIFGDGYAWLVYSNKQRTLHVFNTYGAGTPPILPDASHTSSSLSSAMPGNTVSQLTPILNISAFTHAYLHDYGVYGKRRYLENVWNTIDWEVVKARYLAALPEQKSFSSSSYQGYGVNFSSY